MSRRGHYAILAIAQSVTLEVGAGAALTAAAAAAAAADSELADEYAGAHKKKGCREENVRIMSQKVD